MAAIEEIHRISQFSLETLVLRYEESGPQFIGHLANLRLSFRALVASLFGEEDVKRVEREVRRGKGKMVASELASFQGAGQTEADRNVSRSSDAVASERSEPFAIRPRSRPVRGLGL
jgi:hypothetical protein